MDIPILVQQLTRNSSGVVAKKGRVCLLKKSLYGARQGRFLWGSVIDSDLRSWGFSVSNCDPRLYFLRNNDSVIMLLLIVDDMEFTSNDHLLLHHFKKQLISSFDIKLNGELKTFIGWSISRREEGIHITKKQYDTRLLQRYGFSAHDGVMKPLAANRKMDSDTLPEAIISPSLNRFYPSLVCEISYFAVPTRRDLSVEVAVLSRHLHNPTGIHLPLGNWLMRYIASTLQFGLHFPLTGALHSKHLTTAVDAAWGGDLETRRHPPQ